MSKWNHMKTIPVYSLTDEQRQEAIHEWAEGNPDLEVLLWKCFNNGIETSGCHYGPRSYFDVIVNDAGEKVKKMLYAAKEIPHGQVLIVPEGHNPRSGPTWYSPSLGFATTEGTEEENNKLFTILADAISNGESIKVPENDGLASMLDIYEHFIGRESSLSFRFLKDENGKYNYLAELKGRKSSKEYCDELFLRAGMERDEESDLPFPVWKMQADTYEEISKKMCHFRDVVIDGYNLEALAEITEDMTPGEKALVKRKEFGDSEEDHEKLVKWFEKQLPKTPLSISIKRRTAYLKRRIYSKTMRLARRLLGLYKDNNRENGERRGDER